MDWAFKNVTEIVKLLKSDVNLGLSKKAVKQKFLQHGYNDSPADNVPRFDVFDMLIASVDLIVVILVIVCAIAGTLDSVNNTGVIIGMCLIGYMLSCLLSHHFFAYEKYLASLNRPNSKVIRSGKIQQISSRSLLPGDIVLLEPGDIVPADLRLITANSLSVVELSVGGGGGSVRKSAAVMQPSQKTYGLCENIAYASCIVTSGNARGIVVASGKQTLYSQNNKRMQNRERSKSTLEQQSKNLSHYMSIVLFIFIVFSLLTGVITQHPLPIVLISCLSLAASIMPEWMVVLTGFAIFRGLYEMAHKKRMLIRNPLALEAVNSMDCFIASKNETFTHQSTRVTRVWTNRWEYEINHRNTAKISEVLSLAALCTDVQITLRGASERFMGAPIDVAINLALHKAGLYRSAVDGQYTRLEKARTSGAGGFSSVLVMHSGRCLLVTLGDALSVLERCTHKSFAGEKSPIDAKSLRQYKDTAYEMCKKYNTVLAVAVKEYVFADLSKLRPDEGHFTLHGYVCLSEKKQSGTAIAVSGCQMAGIDLVMLADTKTQGTAFFASSVGVLPKGEKILSGDEIRAMGDEVFQMTAENYKVFASLDAEQRSMLIKALTYKNRTVGQSISGIADVAAANSGSVNFTSANNDTSVILAASDVILQDTSMQGIYRVVKGASNIFANVRQMAGYLITTGMTQMLLLMISLFLPYSTDEPSFGFTPLQIMWCGMIVAYTIAWGMCFENGRSVKHRKKNKGKGLMDGLELAECAVRAVLFAIVVIASYAVGKSWTQDALNPIDPMTYSFVTLVAGLIFSAISIREEEYIFSVKLMRNKTFRWALIINFIALFLITITPLSGLFALGSIPLAGFIAACALALIPLAVNEFIKVIHSNLIYMK